MSQRLQTPEAILSYPFVFKMQKAMDDTQKDKYSCVLVFTDEQQKSPLFKAMKKAAVEAAIEKFGGDKAPGLIRSGKIRMPFRDDPEDIEKKGYPEGSCFITVKNEKKPGIVSIFPDPNNNGKPMSITDEEQIYAGCIVRATINAFGYDQRGNKGVSFGLNNIQKLRDGERLDGRAKAEDEFEADMDAVASLADMGTDGEGDELPEPPKKTRGKAKPAPEPEEEEVEFEEIKPDPRATKTKPAATWKPEKTVQEAMEEVDEKIGKKRGRKPAAAAVGKAADSDDLSDLYE